VHRLPLRQCQRSTFDQPQQLRCRISGQSTLSRSWVCWHVLQPSTVNSTQYRPGSLSVLRWCLLQSSVWCEMHHCDPECFLTYTNMPLFFRGWRSHHSTPTIWTLIDWYRTSVLFLNLWKELLLADLSIMRKKTNCFRSSSLRTDDITALSPLSSRSWTTSFALLMTVNSFHWFYLTSVRRLIPSTMTFCLKYYRIASWSKISTFVVPLVLKRPDSVNQCKRSSVSLQCGCSVPQGSVLGAIEFICYTEDGVAVFNRNSVDHYLYADDKQLYSATTVTDIDTTRQLYSRRSWVVCLSKTTVKCAKNITGVVWKCC